MTHDDSDRRPFLARVTPGAAGASAPEASLPAPADAAFTCGDRTVHLQLGDVATLAHDPAGAASVALVGDVLDAGDDPAAELVRRYLARGETFGRGVYGNWTALVADHRTGHVLAVTDRLGSLRLFHTRQGGASWLSSSLRALPTDHLPLDPVGIAWYLTNGAVHCGRSLFSGATILAGASVTALGDEAPAPRAYWSLDFAPEGEADVAALGQALLERIRAGIRRCTQDQDEVWASLSGGYDSPAICAMLREQGMDRVETFTYVNGEPRPGTDAWVARDMAKVLGFPHRLVDSYSGDLVHHIRENARLGEGVTHPCDEVEAWSRVRTQRGPSDRPVLLVGDHFIVDSPERTQVMGRTYPPGKMRPFSGMEWLTPALPQDVVQAFRAGIEADMAAVHGRAVGERDVHPVAYLTERLPNVIMPWRRVFGGRYFRVRAPMLDNDVIDFLGTVPFNERHGSFYHDAVKAAFPKLLDTPRASELGYPMGLRDEVARQGRRCLSELGSAPSRLDELLPPGVGATILDRAERARSVGTRLERKVRRFLGRTSEEPKVDGPLPISPAQMFRRYLILRAALS